MFSESKTISRFILYFTEDLPLKWDSAPALAVYYAFMPLFAITLPFVKLWGVVKPKDGVRADTLPKRFHDEAVSTNHAGLWYGPLMFVRISGGIMTEVASIFLAVSTREIVSIVSAGFGLYYLTVSILVTVMKGPRRAKEGHTFKRRRQELAASLDVRFHEGCGTCWLCFLVFLAVACCVCVVPVPFYGFYLMQTGDKDNGEIYAWVGFVLFGIVWCAASSRTEGQGVWVGLGILLAGFGVVYFFTSGLTDLVISMLAVGGGVSVICCLLAVTNDE